LAEINFEIRQLEDGGVMGINVLDLNEVSFYDGMYMVLAQDRVCWRTLILAVLNHRILLPES
jgi:hypothetical protein